jgi:hypothetical protein
MPSMQPLKKMLVMSLELGGVRILDRSGGAMPIECSKSVALLTCYAVINLAK